MRTCRVAHRNHRTKKPPESSGGPQSNGVSLTWTHALLHRHPRCHPGRHAMPSHDEALLDITCQGERLPLSTAPAFRHCALISQSAHRDRLAPCGAVATEPVSHTSCCTHCQCARVGVSRVSHRALCLACCLTSSNALQGLPAHPPCAHWQGQAFPGPGFQDGSGTLDNLHQHWLERPAAAHTHHTQQDSSSEPVSALAFREAASLRPPRPGNPLSLIPLLHSGSLI